MITYTNLWKELCSYENLFLAYKKARKHKTKRDYIKKFEKNLEDNLLLLRSELLLHSYEPRPLVNFIIRDPKTRKISKSDFRDRVVHHALCNVIEPIFEKRFINDSYANRKGKGTLKAIQRFDYFKRKASRNNTIPCYILKADIRKYFESVDHNVLIDMIQERIKDERIIWLVRKILANYIYKVKCKGMPLGNLTSQFFASIYLNELDQFAKHKLRVKGYIRYVDDFVMFEEDKRKLECYKAAINEFLIKRLKIELHPDKSKIACLGNSINFLGFRVFYYHKLLKKPNLRKMKQKFELLKQKYLSKEIGYDEIYNFVEGWTAYAKNANTYRLRRKFLKEVEDDFQNEISSKEINRYFKIQKKENHAPTQTLEIGTTIPSNNRLLGILPEIL
jgi:retron-type reverse transcriptase